MKRVLTILAFALLVFANSVEVEAEGFDRDAKEFVFTQSVETVAPVVFLSVEELANTTNLEVKDSCPAKTFSIPSYAKYINYNSRKCVNPTIYKLRAINVRGSPRNSQRNIQNV